MDTIPVAPPLHSQPIAKPTVPPITMSTTNTHIEQDAPASKQMKLEDGTRVPTSNVSQLLVGKIGANLASKLGEFLGETSTPASSVAAVPILPTPTSPTVGTTGVGAMPMVGITDASVRKPFVLKAPFQFISISGKFGSGKDFMRKVILRQLAKHGILCMPFSYADQFKAEVVVKDKIPYAKVYGDERDSKTRSLLQKRGTEEGRHVWGDDVWVDIGDTLMRAHTERGMKVFVGADTRFINEHKSAKAKPALHIRLVAPKRSWDRALKEAKGDVERAKDCASHPSEIEMDSVPLSDFDLVVPNDYGEEEQALSLVTEFMESAIEQYKRLEMLAGVN